ncbi:MAG: cytochrome P450 [Sandaracinaceae bacterium]|jgi:cytochrome P450|nr:cytochrome P450 [Sandaracinaceae bacterium]
MHKPQSTSNRAPDAPGPKGRLILGSLLEAWENPLALFARGSQAHGHVTRFRFINYDYILVSSPEGAKHVLVDNAKNYRKSRNYDGLRVMLGNGLLTSEGDFWKRQRRLSQPAFHRDRLSRFADQMVSVTDEMIAAWQPRAKSGEAFDVHDDMMALTLRIVALTLFDVDVAGKQAADIGDAVTVAVHWANAHIQTPLRVPLLVPIPRNVKFKKALRTLDTLVQNIITQRRATPSQKHDLLAMYMEAEDADTGEKMTDKQLRDEVMTLILAGHETTANALSWTFYLLSQNAEARERMHAEVTRVLSGRAPTFDDVKALEYTGWVLQEAMRLYPPVWVFEREAQEDDMIDGFHIPKGAGVAVSPFIMHRDPAYWENPEAFDPERFSPERSATRSKHLYLPFGGGPRICIGNMFAMMEAQLILARMAQSFRLDHVVGHPVEPDPVVTLRPKHGMLMRIARPPAVS